MQEPARPSRRIEAIDIARALALVAMAIFHFTWDLENFGYLTPGLTEHGGWRLFARCIASSFLFLVGVSLVLANRNGIRWPAFWKRFAMIVVAAAAITLVTLYVTPDAFIFFGILHEIALASLLGSGTRRWASREIEGCAGPCCSSSPRPCSPSRAAGRRVPWSGPPGSSASPPWRWPPSCCPASSDGTGGS